MKRICVASKNPAKLNAVLLGFQKVLPNETFEIEGVSVSSGVADQPISDEEALQGAMNRVENARSAQPEADFWVGLEGGIEDRSVGMQAFAWIVIQSREGKKGMGKTGTFILPQQVATLVREGKELGEADDIVFGRTNSKQENGAVGLLTNNVIDRTQSYASAVVFAFIPFNNPTLF